MDNAKRALYGVDEALAEINKLRALIERRTGLTYAEGKVEGSVTSFGRIKVTGAAVAIVLCDSVSGSIVFNGVTIAGGTSPFVFQIPEGESELTLSGVRNNARALFFGSVKVTNAAT